MQRNQKPEVGLGLKIFLGIILLLLSPLILLMFFFMLGKMFFLYGPALRKVQIIPRYWLTWKHIKLATGLSTKNTLSFLMLYADNYFFEYRLREDTEVEKIKKLRHRRRLHTPKEPLFPEDVIYFEFRIVWRGGRMRPTLKELIQQFHIGLQPRPALALV